MPSTSLHPRLQAHGFPCTSPTKRTSVALHRYPAALPAGIRRGQQSRMELGSGRSVVTVVESQCKWRSGGRSVLARNASWTHSDEDWAVDRLDLVSERNR
jgi:hypothetical protein